MVGVFLPGAEPTSGFLLFVPEDELTILDMTVEGARLVFGRFGRRRTNTSEG